MACAIEKVGVIGAGQMGSGIALVCAQAGYERAAQRRRRRADQGRARHDQRPAGAAGRQGPDRRGEPHGGAGAYRASPRRSTRSRDCDLVIEAASENEETKRKIFTALCARSSKPDAIIASNTSSISITRLASVTADPERFIGIHFMNPVPRMQLVELIRGIATQRRHVRSGQGIRHAGSARRPRCRRISRPSSSTASCCR